MQALLPSKQAEIDALAQCFTDKNCANFKSQGDLLCQKSNFPSLIGISCFNEHIPFELPMPSIEEIDRVAHQNDSLRMALYASSGEAARKHEFENIISTEKAIKESISRPKMELSNLSTSEKTAIFSYAKKRTIKNFTPQAQPLFRSTKSFDLNDFECKMERELMGRHFHFDIGAMKIPVLVFVQREQWPSILMAKKTIGLAEIVGFDMNNEQNRKIYTCNICGQEFVKSSGLGGHKAKVHPNSSPSYIARQHTYRIRKCEREKKASLMKL